MIRHRLEQAQDVHTFFCVVAVRKCCVDGLFLLCQFELRIIDDHGSVVLDAQFRAHLHRNAEFLLLRFHDASTASSVSIRRSTSYRRTAIRDRPTALPPETPPLSPCERARHANTCGSSRSKSSPQNAARRSPLPSRL